MSGNFVFTLTKDNLEPGTNNNTYRVTFPTNYTFVGKQLGLSSLNIYYSWFNISAAYGNNTFSYIWTDGTTVNVTLPDGFYTVDILNEYLQYTFNANNHYLIDQDGNEVYFIALLTNPVYYKIQLNVDNLPSSLPTSWTYPPGATWTVNGNTPQFVTTNTQFNLLIGFNSGTYPTPVQTSAYAKLSDFIPQISPVASVLVKCSLCLNPLSNFTSVIHSFAPSNATFGSFITSAPPEIVWLDITNGSAQTFIIQFVDQSNRPLIINDPEIVCVLAVRDAPRK